MWWFQLYDGSLQYLEQELLKRYDYDPFCYGDPLYVFLVYLQTQVVRV